MSKTSRAAPPSRPARIVEQRVLVHRGTSADVDTEEQIIAIAEELGDLVGARRDAEPDHKL